MNVVDLQNFYASPLGKATHRLLMPKLQAFLAAPDQSHILGLGYATPYLEAKPETLAFMMARRGVMHWPVVGLVKSALVDEYDLPLPDNSVDLVLVTHGLEFTDEPIEMLEEIWRVLTPQGRLVLVVPNRRGLWSLSDSSPFGFGQPFSQTQLSRLLKDAQFSIARMESALFMPPWGSPLAERFAHGLERFGSAALGHFSGVLISVATKQVYAYARGRRQRRLLPRLRPALLGRPQISHREKSEV